MTLRFLLDSLSTLMDIFCKGWDYRFSRYMGMCHFCLLTTLGTLSFIQWIPNLEGKLKTSLMLHEVVRNVNVRYIVSILYRHLLPPDTIMRTGFQDYFTTPRNEANSDMKVHQIYYIEEVATEGVVVE